MGMIYVHASFRDVVAGKLHEWCREQSQKNGESGVSSSIVVGPGNSLETVGLLVPDAFAETLPPEIGFTR
jgi:hypothetical protein